jgi:oligopeptidase B
VAVTVNNPGISPERAEPATPAVAAPAVAQSLAVAPTPAGAQSLAVAAVPAGAESLAVATVPAGAQSLAVATVPAGAQSLAVAAVPAGAQSLAVAAVPAVAPAPAVALAPPVATVRPHPVDSPHGRRIDPYYWLRDDERAGSEVLAYLAAENDYQRHCRAAVGPLEEELFAEIIARLKQDDASVPYRKNGFWYYTRFETGKEHPIFARRRAAPGAAASVAAGLRQAGPEEILLDANELAIGHDYYQIGALELAPNSEWLAFCEDIVGRRQYRLRFKDLRAGRIEQLAIEDVEADLAWANDNRTVLYIEKDPETLLGLDVKKHVLGTDPRHDALVFHQTDKSFYTGLSKSKSERFIFLSMESTISSEWRYAEAADPELEFKVFLPRERNHEYQIEHWGGQFFVRTNFEAQNFRLMSVPIESAGSLLAWRDLVPHRPDTFIEDFDVFDSFLALSVRSQGLCKISILTLTGAAATGLAEDFFIASDEAAYTTSISSNPEMSTEVIRYTYSSLTTPTTVYEYNVRTGEKTLLKREPVLGNFDPRDYRTEFRFATGRDGATIPISIVYRREFAHDSSAPLLLYAYGAYGLSMDPVFSSARLSLLDRGFVYAIAHVRGGQELGRAWYDSGRLQAKMHSFEDFIDVTKYLVAQRYAAPDKVFAMGGSAGGLLMGAVANLAGSLYRGIIAQVPFVDVVTTMLDDSIPLTTNEYDEWGNPKDKAAYDYMLSYSPYDNVRRAEYPAMLVTTGLWDSQVQYYEPAKWVAKLRALKTDRRPLLLYVDMESGHGGKSGRFQHYREVAMEYAFLLNLAKEDGST